MANRRLLDNFRIQSKIGISLKRNWLDFKTDLKVKYTETNNLCLNFRSLLKLFRIISTLCNYLFTYILYPSTSKSKCSIWFFLFPKKPLSKRILYALSLQFSKIGFSSSFKIVDNRSAIVWSIIVFSQMVYITFLFNLVSCDIRFHSQEYWIDALNWSKKYSKQASPAAPSHKQKQMGL